MWNFLTRKRKPLSFDWLLLESLMTQALPKYFKDDY